MTMLKQPLPGTNDERQLARLLEETVTLTRQMSEMLLQLADDLERIGDCPPELRRGAYGFEARAVAIEQTPNQLRAAPQTAGRNGRRTRRR
jgi:hypothetical protein